MKLKHKVVFDTQIFLRALISRNSPCYRLTTEFEEFYILHVADEIIKEIVDVLNRPEIRRKFPQITESKVRLTQEKLNLAIQLKLTPEDIEPICRDPKDDIFLACAKLAQADYLVSEDQDLLVLKQHHDTKILNTIEFLDILKNLPEN